MQDKIENNHLYKDLIPSLHVIQKKYNYLPEAELEILSREKGISISQILGVASFYAQFRLKPAGKHFIKVCTGTACHVKGALNVFDAFSRYLKLSNDSDTDEKGEFTLQKVACLGCCTLAPAVQIDEVTYGKVTQSDVPEIIENFRRNSGNENFTKAESSSALKSNVEIRLGLGSCCVASGSGQVYDLVVSELEKLGANPKIKQVGCVGMCHQVPLMEVVSESGDVALYSKVSTDDVRGILKKHFKQKGLAARLKGALLQNFEQFYYAEKYDSAGKCLISVKEKQVADFQNRQVNIATEHKGILNPLDLDEFIAAGGFRAFEICKSRQPAEIIELIEKSGLRGRGGAGFLTGTKWKIFASQSSVEKYIICNGDEGDPGAFMDRMLVESFPFRIIEGMLIAAYATGAKQGIIYIRNEYQLAVSRMAEAIDICREKKFLGSTFNDIKQSFDIRIFEGAGAFVCGEETALIKSMEGKRGTPELRPPYPVEMGFSGMPSLVNNVETFANISWIVNNSSDKFYSIGTAKSKGTKVFALAGKINRGGLIEVPMGITLNEIVYEIGGGIQNGKSFKAVQIGGPSGGCIPASMGNTIVDFDSLSETGAMMGSGGLIVLDETDCIVDIAKYFLSFTQGQSCGKCVYCRVGTKHMLELLNKISCGKGTMEDIDKLHELSVNVKEGSICGLGKNAPNPVLTTLKYFKDEYIEHIKGNCPSKKCKDLITYTINTNCIGCTKCHQECPTGAIDFRPHELHCITQSLCIKCDACKQACPVDAVDLK